MKCWKRIVVCLLTGVYLAGAQTNETKVSKPISIELAKKAISAIEQDPLGDISEAAIAVLLQFAEESEDVVVTIDDSIMPLLQASQEHEYGKVLFAAFIAGNIKVQLDSGVCEDQREAGIAQAIATYNYLKEHTDIESNPIIEEWIEERHSGIEPKSTTEESTTESDDKDSVWSDRLEQGRKQIESKEPYGAIADHLDPVIEHYEETYKDETRTIYCAANMKETVAYTAMSLPKSSEDSGTLVLDQVWAEAYYLKAYSFVELNQLDQAKAALQHALKLSPRHSQYWAELGHVFQTEKDWKRCMTAYEKAAESASFSDDDMEKNHLTRAWRGMGFVLVELGKLTAAEEKYKQCLELDPNDKRAKAELDYIKGLRGK